MNPASTKLSELMLDLSQLTDDEAEANGRALYFEEFITYCGRSGDIKAHDGVTVRFFADRYDHAFRTSPDRSRQQHSKAKVARDRIERALWIRPILEGKVLGSECWEVPMKVPEERRKPFPGKRLYVCWADKYVVWLEPRESGDFKFSTAYPLPPADIARYTRNARKLWERKAL